jgi:hypothetical protein
MRILWDLPLLQQRVSSAALEERAQDRLQAQRAWISRCSTSRASLNLDACNERKHGGVAEPIRRIGKGFNPKKKGKEITSFAISDGRNVLIDYYIYREY